MTAPHASLTVPVMEAVTCPQSIPASNGRTETLPTQTSARRVLQFVNRVDTIRKAITRPPVRRIIYRPTNRFNLHNRRAIGALAIRASFLRQGKTEDATTGGGGDDL